MKPSIIATICAFILLSRPGYAVELHEIDVDRGTQHLEKTPIEITNAGTGELSCTAELAHWYSELVATIAPGSTAVIDLWFAPRTGTVLLLNPMEDNMPVEALWCGIAGRAYKTRAALRTDRDTAGPRRIACAASGDRVICE